MAITKKKNGKYQVRVYVGYDHITGKRKTKYATCETMREARLKEAQLITDVETGELVADWEAPKVQKHYTFDEAYEEWFDIYKRQDLAKATIVKTEKNFRNYLLKPELFGGMYLERMSRRDVQRRINEFMPKYVQSHEIIGYANRLLKWAVNNEEIAFDDNPLEHVTWVKAKKSKKREIRYYTEEQVKKFQKGLYDHWGDTRPDLVALFTLLIRTGARIGEILALHWDNIDFSTAQIKLCGRISYINSEYGCEYLEGLKNGDVSRTIDIDPIVLRELRIWKLEQKKLYFRYGVHATDKSLLFSSPKPENFGKEYFRDHTAVNQTLRKFYDWYDRNHTEPLPRLNVHGFRHTHASLLLSNGMGLKQVSDRLGHRDISITANVYADVTPSAKREVADKFSQIMGDNA